MGLTEADRGVSKAFGSLAPVELVDLIHEPQAAEAWESLVNRSALLEHHLVVDVPVHRAGSRPGGTKLRLLLPVETAPARGAWRRAAHAGGVGGAPLERSPPSPRRRQQHGAARVPKRADGMAQKTAKTKDANEMAQDGCEKSEVRDEVR